MIAFAGSAPPAALIRRVRAQYREMPALKLTKPQATRDCMNRKCLVAFVGLVAWSAVLSAQAPSSNGKLDQKTVQSIRVKVTGCVTGDTEAPGYILTGAFLSGDDTPPTVGTSGKIGSGKDLSFENSFSYDLIGGRLETHVGHEVEIIGITSDAKLNNTDALGSAGGSSKHQRATLTVESVKMLGAECR